LTASDYNGGRIERVDVGTGTVECLYDASDKHRLNSPMTSCPIVMAARCDNDEHLLWRRRSEDRLHHAREQREELVSMQWQRPGL